MKFHDRRFIFTAGHLCIDFAHTGGTGSYAKFERLREPMDLIDWFALSQLKLSIASASVYDLTAARELRNALWFTAHAVIAKNEIAVNDLKLLNTFAGHPAPAPLLKSEKWVWRPGMTAAHGLSAIARDAIELFGGDKRNRLKECANPQCALLFVDNSRPGKRKWCTMQRCGNLRKTARYRKKQRRRIKHDKSNTHQS